MNNNTVILAYNPKVQAVIIPQKSINLFIISLKKAASDKYINMLQMGSFVTNMRTRIRHKG